MTRPLLRILCFGDSLTAGYTAFGSAYHPYAEKLAQMLSMALPHVDIEAVEDGKPGDMVRGGFAGRLGRQLKKAEKPYDWVIILGGTNDLAYANINPDDIYAELKRVWDLALSKRCKVLALTVPEAGVQGFRAHMDARRNRLNELIKGHVQEGLYTFDLHAALPYFSLSSPERQKIWDDSVHLTAAGYDLMGQKIGMHLVSVLMKEKAYPPIAPKRRRLPGFKDDKLPFEEETGDPRKIEEGWYVVRWDDLV